MNKIRAAYSGVLLACGLVASVVVVLLAVFTSLDVARRNLGMGNFPWVVEVAEYGMLIITFLAAPWVLAEGGHVKVDIVLAALPPQMQRLVQTLIDLLGLAISGIVFWYSLRAVLQSYAQHSLVFKQLVIPEWWVLTPVPFGAALLIGEFVLRLLGVRADIGKPSGAEAL